MTEAVQRKAYNKEIDSSLRKIIYYQLIAMAKDGALKSGSYGIVAAHHGVAPRQVGRAYREVVDAVNEYRQQHNEVLVLPDTLFQNKRINCSRPLKYDRDALEQAIKAIPLKERETFRYISSASGVSVGTVHTLFKKEKFLRQWRASLKPVLTEANMLTRVCYALEMLNPPTSTRSQRTFKDCFDVVHVDEKWFYLIRDGAKYLLVHNEKPPVLRTKHKRNILKVMFICAVARPRYVNNVYWDGKIGIWPVGYQQEAKKDSVNRPAGTIEWKNLSIDTVVYTDLVSNLIIPAIVAKWPSSDWNVEGKVIKIQQDGAPAHKRFHRYHWEQVVHDLYLEEKLELVTQPPNSPDCNVLDLGFFRSLQAKYYMSNPKTALDIIRFVQKAFDDYNPNDLNRIWLTYHTVLDEIIKCHGNNTYDIPHCNKKKLEREKKLPLSMPLTADNEWTTTEEEAVEDDGSTWV